MIRTVSMLPAATEIVGALGLMDQLLAVSHECDYPEQRFPEEPKHLQDKDLRVHYFAKKSLSWYAPNIRP